MTSVRENLIAAKALIDTPEKWIRHGITNADGTCFCAMGAIASVTGTIRGNGWTSDTAEYFALSAAVPTGRPVPTFNDDPTTTHADIMSLFDRAISSLNEEGKDK